MPPPWIQGFAKQAALPWKESDSGRQESWNESGRQGPSVGPPPRGLGLSQQEEREPVPRAHWVRGRSCRNAPLASQWGIIIITATLTPTFQTCRGASTSAILSGTNLQASRQGGLGSSSAACPRQPRQVSQASVSSLLEGMLDPASPSPFLPWLLPGGCGCRTQEPLSWGIAQVCISDLPPTCHLARPVSSAMTMLLFCPDRGTIGAKSSAWTPPCTPDCAGPSALPRMRHHPPETIL